MSKTKTMATISMYHADWKIITDFNDFKVYHVCNVLGEDGYIHTRKILMQKYKNMKECLAYILDFERIADIGTNRQ